MGEIIEKHLNLEFKNQTYITVCFDLYIVSGFKCTSLAIFIPERHYPL